MNIHEYQAKELLKNHGIPVPPGEVVYSDRAAARVAEELGGSRWVVKAQIHAGGRGKGGGIKLADDPAGAEAAATQILGMMLKTPQTPPEGIKVRKVLVEEASAIDRGPDNREKKQQRQHRRRGRHEHHTSSQADGGLGSGAANSSFFPRMRRSAQAIGS